MVAEHQDRDPDINAFGSIISAIGCTSSCAAIPFTGALNCDNEGVVQIRYRKDGDPTWIEDNIAPPFICSAEPCCFEYIESNITLFFHVDGDEVGLIYSSATPTGDLLLGLGITAIVIGVISLGAIVVIAFRFRSGYSQV